MYSAIERSALADSERVQGHRESRVARVWPRVCVFGLLHTVVSVWKIWHRGSASEGRGAISVIEGVGVLDVIRHTARVGLGQYQGYIR
jgi:hypothetical protein